MAGLEKKEFAVLTLLNVLYLVSVGCCVWLFVDMYNGKGALQGWAEWLLMVTYWLPTWLCYIFISLAYLIIATKENPATLHADRIMMLFLGIIIFRGRRLYEFGDNRLTMWCDAHATHGVFIVINVTLVYLATAALFLFLPLISVGWTYHYGDDIPKWIALSFQWLSCALNILFHLFTLHIFGYFSLAVIVSSLAHIVIGSLYYYSSSDIIVYPKWFIFEIVWMLQMIAITFMIKYDGALLIVAVVFGVNYVFPNVPYLKSYLYQYYKDKVQSSQIFTFIRNYDTVHATHIPLKVRVYDKMYCILHSSVHNDKQQEKASADGDDDVADAELMSLLTLEYDNRQSHQFNSPQCFKTQHDYLKLDAVHRRRLIHALQPKKKRYRMQSILVYLYALSSGMAIIYPLVWIGSVWVYATQYRAFVGGATVDGDDMAALWSAQYLLIDLVSVAYVVMALYWMYYGVRMVWHSEYGVQLTKEMSIFAVVYSENKFSDLNESKQLFERQGVVQALLEAKGVQLDIGLLILSYLYQ